MSRTGHLPPTDLLDPAAAGVKFEFSSKIAYSTFQYHRLVSAAFSLQMTAGFGYVSLGVRAGAIGRCSLGGDAIIVSNISACVHN